MIIDGETENRFVSLHSNVRGFVPISTTEVLATYRPIWTTFLVIVTRCCSSTILCRYKTPSFE